MLSGPDPNGSGQMPATTAPRHVAGFRDASPQEIALDAQLLFALNRSLSTREEMAQMANQRIRAGLAREARSLEERLGSFVTIEGRSEAETTASRLREISRTASARDVPRLFGDEATRLADAAIAFGDRA